MLTAEQNDELTQVAPGTPMGELLRRYWYPVAFTRELEEFPVKHARLLGEDFARVTRRRRGRYGIVPEACPHRRASLAYGVVEADGLRCPYHGWLFGTDGACLEQPAERDETNFRDRVRASAGQVAGAGRAGLGLRRARSRRRSCRGSTSSSWTACATSAGPTCPATSCRSWRTPSTRTTSSGCTAATSSSWAATRASTRPRRSARSTSRSASTPFEWGIIKRRVLEGATEEDDDWKVGHPLVFPYNMRVGGANIEQMQIRVPIDRTTTRFMLYTVHAPDGVEYPEQPQVPDYQIPVFDENGRHRDRLRRGPGHHGVGDPGPDHRPDRGAPGPFGRRRDDAAQDVQGADGARSRAARTRSARIPGARDRIDLPCEKNKFDAGGPFALDFIDRPRPGSARRPTR